MGVYSGPNTITTSTDSGSLVLNLSAANKLSYSGSGITWNNIAENTITGSLINGSTFNNVNGGVIVFDGIDDYADIGSSSLLNITGSITIDTWVLLTATSSNYTRIVGKGDSANRTYGLWYNVANPANNHFLYQRYGSSNVGLFYYNPINLNTWYNVVATSNNTTHSIYINGTLVQTGTTVSSSFLSSTASFSVGFSIPNYDSGLHRYHPGYVSEVKIYNRALNSGEILQNYNALKSRFDSFF